MKAHEKFRKLIEIPRVHLLGAIKDAIQHGYCWLKTDRIGKEAVLFKYQYKNGTLEEFDCPVCKQLIDPRDSINHYKEGF